MDTVNGIVVVRNREQGIWSQGQAWHLREEFRIGSPDGPPEETFTGTLTAVGVSPAGRIYVLDPSVNEIKVYEGTGGFVRRIGGSGGGPDKLASPSAIAWDPAGRLWVANAFNGRYTVFDSEGELVKTVPRPLRSLPRRQSQLLFRGRSTLVDEVAGPSGQAYFLELDTLGTVVDTLFTLTHPDRPSFWYPPGFDRTVVNYLPLLVWRLAPDGTVWMSESGQLRLVQTTVGGDTLRIVETRHRSPTIGAALREHIEREFKKAGVDLASYQLAWPLVQAINVLGDGHVLVQVADEAGVPGHLLDVFDPEGRFLGTMDMGFRMTTRGVAALTGDTLIAVALGDLDVPYVVRVTIDRNSSRLP